jgi:hypothetical protein
MKSRARRCATTLNPSYEGGSKLPGDQRLSRVANSLDRRKRPDVQIDVNRTEAAQLIEGRVNFVPVISLS